MARCLLCSRAVDDGRATCPTCGGAVADDHLAAGPPPAWGPPAGWAGAPPAPGPGPTGYHAPGYGAPGYGPPGYGPAPPVPVDGMAVASLVVSITGLVLAPFLYLPLLACPVGALLGHGAVRRIDRERRTGGRGLAIAGLVVGWVGTALLVLGAAFVGWLLWALSTGGE